jgi:hypothetical protein
MTTAHDLIVLIGDIAETKTSGQLTEQAGENFTATFGAAALASGLPAKMWDEIQKAYTGGYLHGYAAAVADLTVAAAMKHAARSEAP